MINGREFLLPCEREKRGKVFLESRFVAALLRPPMLDPARSENIAKTKTGKMGIASPGRRNLTTTGSRLV